MKIKNCKHCGVLREGSICKPCNKIRNDKWRAENPSYNAKYYAANSEKIKAATATRYALNPEKANAAVAAWKRNNPGKRRIWEHNREAKIRSGGKLSNGLIGKLFDLQKGMCACCGKKLGDDYHLDHRMPLALGGTNTDGNMQLLTATCNMSKGAKHPVDFMQSRGFLL